MNRTAIVTDTNSGISPSEGKELGIFVVQMPVIVDGETYFEGSSIDHAGLYAAMKEDRDLSTSQPAIGIVGELWDSILAQGYEEIVYIPMSSGLSSSCTTAKGLAAGYDGKVEVADNHRISVTQRHSVMDAHRLAAKGKSAAEIRAYLEETALDSVVYLGVDTLKYFKKNGRASAAAVAVAAVLNLKPILITEGGKFDSFAKVRGLKACKDKIIEAIHKELDTRFKGIPASQIRIATAGTLETAEDAEAWRSFVQESFPTYEVIYDPLSCSIACHTGMGAVGVGISRILID
ncbi:MAG: DegV family protein [Oscillospiraceae bacterium]|nr:DegV family protein [Oscillospiraceae bacterium]